MGINGDNNRVAGRDYYELNAVLKLTPEQLKQVAIKPCARCEDRVVSSDMTICNHCCNELEEKARNEHLARYAFVIFFVWGLLLQWQAARPNGVSPQLVFELGAIAFVIVIAGTFAWALLQTWWRINGSDVLRLVGRFVTRLLKRGRQ
ncbi:hypothetical protein CGU37_22265 [Pseudomonas fluorescens]|nr:hypothetical protein CGU36_23305 [Pseudomonas fluorescens]OZO46823.1 hypothetical protein CGU37_22265 [Pseudomonas fluorescens]TGY15878.1 hypothetical protein E5845_19960 [Pseudomonas fluorescens]